jgi:hypothetical protein
MINSPRNTIQNFHFAMMTFYNLSRITFFDIRSIKCVRMKIQLPSTTPKLCKALYFAIITFMIVFFQVWIVVNVATQPSPQLT